jgi:hypothetical protein
MVTGLSTAALKTALRSLLPPQQMSAYRITLTHHAGATMQLLLALHEVFVAAVDKRDLFLP